MNLENENVGIVVFGSDTAIKERDLVQRSPSLSFLDRKTQIVKAFTPSPLLSFRFD